MIKNKFKENDIVLYKNGDRYELGVVKKVVPQPYTKVYKTASAEEIGEDMHYAYFVYYHTGSTAALTNEEDLYEIVNNYAFLILRRSVEKETGIAKDLAEFLISCSPIKDTKEAELYCETFAALINNWYPGQKRVEYIE